MKTRIIAIVIVALGTFGACSAEGQALRDVFKRVSSSVVVIRSVQREVIARPQSQPVMAAGLGSGVLASNSGAQHQAAERDRSTLWVVDIQTADVLNAPWGTHRASRRCALLTRTHVGSDIWIESREPSQVSAMRLGIP
jgi:hypothetical protein